MDELLYHTTELDPSKDDVVKTGCLSIKRPPVARGTKINFTIKTWQKRYLVLRDLWLRNSTSRLEIYEREVHPEDNSTDGAIVCYKLDLKGIVYVDIYTESRRFPHAFIVHRVVDTPIIFGAESEIEMKGWLLAIKLLSDKAKLARFSGLEDKPRRPSCPPRFSQPATSTVSSDDFERLKAAALRSRCNSSSPQLQTFLSSSCTCPQTTEKRNSRIKSSYLDVIRERASYLERVSLPLSPSNTLEAPETVHRAKRLSTERRKDSGFSDSFEEDMGYTDRPPAPPPRPLHTISH